MNPFFRITDSFSTVTLPWAVKGVSFQPARELSSNIECHSSATGCADALADGIFCAGDGIIIAQRIAREIQHKSFQSMDAFYHREDQQLLQL